MAWRDEGQEADTGQDTGQDTGHQLGALASKKRPQTEGPHLLARIATGGAAQGGGYQWGKGAPV